jgi:hypothetical protein
MLVARTHIEVQRRLLALVNAVLNHAPSTAQIVQRLQQPPELMENMLFFATKKHPLGAATGNLLLAVALHLVQRIVQHDPQAAGQIAALSAAVYALIKSLDSKDSNVQTAAGILIKEVRRGKCQLVSCPHCCR